ncbi:DUF2249 domain-containing protein [Natrononativus amylolyticus]|uniref:DUF2249 domain-containing protein n=1 Tax=Natrononativus amylolyticus TaxID=2963434 RepID=UPI0020CFBF83|nr:DUF2249 domain-containing protein [Natrononativus amylolyticus]
MPMTHSEHRLDVREIEGPPFGEIMAALDGLEADERLRLIAGFEPKPLYEVLETRGFTYQPERRADEEWHVLIELA